MSKPFLSLTYYQRTARLVAYILAAIVMTRLTSGAFSVVLLLAGIWFASTKRYGEAMSLFILFPFMVILNHSILPKTTLTRYMLRFGPLLIGLVLAAVSSGRKGLHVLPFGAMIPYLIVEGVSSINGYAPIVSYMKLVNFILFLVAVWFGTRNLHRHVRDIQIIRASFMALSCILIFGSIMVLPWPTVAYSTSYGGSLAQELGTHFSLLGMAESQEAFEAVRGSNMRLFSGITFHSQALGPIAGCVFTWILCDMVFLERRIRWLHSSILAACIPVLYLTRSRCALLVAISGITMVLFYAAPRIRLNAAIRRKITTLFVSICCLIAIAAIVSELNDQRLSKWLRKTDNVAADARSSVDALTESRQGLIANMMADFRRNPMLGCGFQVDYRSAAIAQYFASQGQLTLSVPIEKGLLPLMVLGEGGIIGAAAFTIFLLAFCTVCARKKLYVTIALFWTVLAVNMGEATFFSPGGPGGIEWCVCIIGGFVIDTLLLYPEIRLKVMPELEYGVRDNAIIQ